MVTVISFGLIMILSISIVNRKFNSMRVEIKHVWENQQMVDQSLRQIQAKVSNSPLDEVKELIEEINLAKEEIVGFRREVISKGNEMICTLRQGLRSNKSLMDEGLSEVRTNISESSKVISQHLDKAKNVTHQLLGLRKMLDGLCDQFATGDAKTLQTALKAYMRFYPSGKEHEELHRSILKLIRTLDRYIIDEGYEAFKDSEIQLNARSKLQEPTRVLDRL